METAIASRPVPGESFDLVGENENISHNNPSSEIYFYHKSLELDQSHDNNERNFLNLNRATL